MKNNNKVGESQSFGLLLHETEGKHFTALT